MVRKGPLSAFATLVVALHVFTSYADALGAVVCSGPEGQIERHDADHEHGAAAFGRAPRHEPLRLDAPDACCYAGRQVDAIAPDISRVRHELAPIAVPEPRAGQAPLASVDRKGAQRPARDGPPAALAALRTVQILI